MRIEIGAGSPEFPITGERDASDVGETRSDDASPIRAARKRAKSLRYRARLPLTTRLNLERIANVTVVHAGLFNVLDLELAPERVCRWVAYGRSPQHRAVRMGIALLLRREAAIHNPRRAAGGWTWARDHILAAAESYFWASSLCMRLVKTRVLDDPKTDPSDANLIAWSTGWDRTWPTLQRELSALNPTTLLVEAQRIAATRKRRRARRKVPIHPKVMTVLDGLEDLRRDVLRGVVPPEALVDLVEHRREREAVAASTGAPTTSSTVLKKKATRRQE